MIVSINVTPEDAMKWYSQLPSKLQSIAQYRFERVSDLHALIQKGFGMTLALTCVASDHEIPVATLLKWSGLVDGDPCEDWLPQLVPTISKTSLKVWLDGGIACPCCGAK